MGPEAVPAHCWVKLVLGFWWQGPGVQNLVLACPWMGLKTKESWICCLGCQSEHSSQVAGVSERPTVASMLVDRLYPLPIDLGLPQVREPTGQWWGPSKACQH